MPQNNKKSVKGVYNIERHRTGIPKDFQCKFHSHDVWEIYVYIDGGVIYYIEDKVYDLIRGDILIIPPGKMHQSILTDDTQAYERIVLSVDNGFVEKICQQSLNAEKVFKKIRRSNEYIVNFKSDDIPFIFGLFDRMNKSGTDDSFKLSMLTCFFHTVADQMISVSCDRGEYEDSLVSEVIKYISSHYTEQITLDDICREFFVSKFYINRRFKEYTNLTIYDYVLSKRIGLARRLIRNGITAVEASERCGFADYSTFYRAFVSKAGMTPKQYKTAYPDHNVT